MTASHTIDESTITGIMLTRMAQNLERIASFMQTHTLGMIVASGPMRGGKTKTLIAVIDSLHVPILCVKPKRDNRQNGMRTHTGIEVDAFGVTTVEELVALVYTHEPQIVLADEWQFADVKLTEALIELARERIVIVGMLDTTFHRTEWETHRVLLERGPKLLPSSFMHLKLIGVCQRCGSLHATHSALTIAPPANGDSVLTGADIYHTVCGACHTPPPSQ